MVEVNPMRLGQFELVLDVRSFLRITSRWFGPGWDLDLRGSCINDYADAATLVEDGIWVCFDAALLPFAKAMESTRRRQSAGGPR